jgi:NAD dependent epimerase/dehydratase
MKNVLVTGGDGFVGSHLTEQLVKLGYKVKSLSQYNSFNNWGWLEDLECKNDIEILSGDIRDYHFCNKISKGVDIIFHLASLIAIPYSYIAPDSYVDTNIKGTLNMCQAAKENKVQRFIHTSTSEVYGTAKYVPIDEDHPLQPQSPYSATKIGADAMAMSFYNAFDLPVTIVRPFNTYGPRQSARAVIPTVIIQIAMGMDEINLGDISPTRDFNYVEDTCRGFILLSEDKAAIGQTINIGSNTEISISDTVDLIKELMKSNIKIKHDAQRFRPKNSEVFRLFCDNGKINMLTGYEPRIELKEGIQRTINWILEPNNLKKYKAEIYNL